jgi:predicted O-methyltransferase YrrM
MRIKDPGRFASQDRLMNTPHSVKRRDFLRQSLSGAGFLGFLEGLGNASILGAEGGAKSEQIQSVLSAMEAKGAGFLSVPRKDGEFLKLLIKVSRARNVLEVGTSHGYSAIWISLGLEEADGKLTTIEILPERVQLAKHHLKEAGLSQRVTFLEGDAHKVVPALEGPFDFVFLDADKEGQMDYFKKLYPGKLVPGGLLVVHNAIRAADPMKDFLGMIRQHQDFDSVTLSLTMDDGFCVNYRHRRRAA